VGTLDDLELLRFALANGSTMVLVGMIFQCKSSKSPVPSLLLSSSLLVSWLR